MTPAEAEALGRRWLAAGGGWRDGMLCVRPRSSWRVLNAASWPTEGEQWPDLRDPATRGAAMEVVRERLNDPGIFIRPRGSKARPDWAAFTSDSNLIVAAPTEEEVLVAALESAPKETP